MNNVWRYYKALNKVETLQDTYLIIFSSQDRLKKFVYFSSHLACLCFYLWLPVRHAISVYLSIHPWTLNCGNIFHCFIGAVQPYSVTNASTAQLSAFLSFCFFICTCRLVFFFLSQFIRQRLSWKNIPMNFHLFFYVQIFRLYMNINLCSIMYIQYIHTTNALFDFFLPFKLIAILRCKKKMRRKKKGLRVL